MEVQAGLAGRWGAPVVLKVHRKPTLRETWWFELGLVLIAITLLVAIGMWRLYLARERERQLRLAVAEHTAELAAANAELVATARRLTELDELKNRFVANISHELRTPLTLVLGPLEDLAPAVTPEGRSSLRRVQRNAERLDELIEQLMDVARLHEESMGIQAESVDLAEVLWGTLDRFVSAAQTEDIGLSWETAPGVRAYVDTELMDKVVSNLVGNALKFTPAGGHVIVHLCEVSGAVPVARVEVRDDGPGVPEGEEESIFDRFHQGHRTDARPHGGVGIGLSLVRDLVSLHGGEVGYQPRAGGGSCFWFTIPLGVDHLAPDQIRVGAQPQEAASNSRLQCGEDDLPLLLLAEDNDDMSAYLSEHLSQSFRVVSAANGARALAFARQQRPAVLVSDVMMPEMDGLELCRRLREDPTLHDLPVLLVSVKAARMNRDPSFSLAQHYLTKPFNMRELITRVHELAGTPPHDVVVNTLPEGHCDVAFVERIREVTDRNLSDPDFGVASLAKALGASRRQLQRKTRSLLGCTPKVYLRERKMTVAHDLLARGGRETVAEVAASVGLSPSYFTALYTSWEGRSPSTVLKMAGGT